MLKHFAKTNQMDEKMQADLPEIVERTDIFKSSIPHTKLPTTVPMAPTEISSELHWIDKHLCHYILLSIIPFPVAANINARFIWKKAASLQLLFENGLVNNGGVQMRSRVDSNFFYSENFTAVKQSLSRRRVKHLALFYYLKKISVQTRVQKGKMEDGNQDIGDWSGSRHLPVLGIDKMGQMVHRCCCGLAQERRSSQCSSKVNVTRWWNLVCRWLNLQWFQFQPNGVYKRFPINNVNVMKNSQSWFIVTRQQECIGKAKHVSTNRTTSTFNQRQWHRWRKRTWSGCLLSTFQLESSSVSGNRNNNILHFKLSIWSLFWKVDCKM